jgi:hypothetical protein
MERGCLKWRFQGIVQRQIYPATTLIAATSSLKNYSRKRSIVVG